jgi:PD-(D/E)XK endonuclease
MERLINRRQQGDLGEASAIEWLTRQGATVFIPVGHSPHFDLVAALDARLLRIQVKASTQEVLTPDGHRRSTEYEIKRCNPIREIVYAEHPSLESGSRPGGVSKRSKDGGCKPSGSAFAGSNPASPIVASTPVKPTKYERELGQSGQAIVNQKRRITIPQRAFFEAGFENGSRVRVRADGPGRIILDQVELPARRAPHRRASSSAPTPDHRAADQPGEHRLRTRTCSSGRGASRPPRPHSHLPRLAPA